MSAVVKGDTPNSIQPQVAAALMVEMPCGPEECALPQLGMASHSGERSDDSGRVGFAIGWPNEVGQLVNICNRSAQSGIVIGTT